MTDREKEALFTGAGIKWIRVENGEVTRVIVNGVESVVKTGSSIIQAVPRHEWPLWVKALCLLAKPEDKGIGDVIARTIGDERSESFKRWYKATFGKSCGCTGRQAKWNALYPF
jgi:hypothetical protein